MTPPDSDLDFLKQDPEQVSPATRAQPRSTFVLPKTVVDRLMSIDGVDGVWIEARTDGSHEVVIYVTKPSALDRLPTRVEGLPVRPQLGEPIKALQR
jgi:hypothetical protein